MSRSRICQSQRVAPGSSWRTLVVGLLTLLVLVVAVGTSSGDPPPPPLRSPEYAVKSAFLFNFAKFVEWPEGTFRVAEGQLRVCVLGDDPFGPVLDETIAGKEMVGVRLSVERLGRADEATQCAIVFFGPSEAASRRDALDYFREKPVLTVGEGQDFAEAGGVIGMFIESNRVRFAINPEAAERARLKISSKLLSLARIVEDMPAGKN